MVGSIPSVKYRMLLGNVVAVLTSDRGCVRLFLAYFVIRHLTGLLVAKLCVFLILGGGFIWGTALCRFAGWPDS